MTGNGSVTSEMVAESNSGLTAFGTKASGAITWHMVKVKKYTLTAMSTRVSGVKIELAASVQSLEGMATE